MTSTAHALQWAYPFVVWNGKVYEVMQEEIIKDSDIERIIGRVVTKPNDMTGEYYGNASNYYPRGTKYYKIKGIPTSTAIAVKEENKWIKADYSHKVPIHMMNVILDFYFASAVIIVTLTIVRLRHKRLKD